MLKFEKFILICALTSLCTSCGIANPIGEQTPFSPVKGLQTQTPNSTFVPQSSPSKTQTPIHTSVRFTEIGNLLTITQVFQEHGKPGEVLFSSTGKVPETWPTYIEIVLYYPEKSMLFLYGGKAEQIKENDQFIISICAAKYDDIKVEEFVTTAFTWSPSMNWNFSDIPPLPSNPDTHWKPLDRVTNSNINDFYSATLNNSSTACLKTPAELWPNPDN